MRHIPRVGIADVLGGIEGGRVTEDIGNCPYKHLLSGSTALPQRCKY